MSTRGASAIQTVDWDTVNLLRPFFDKGPDPIGARLLDLPMLRGAWVTSVDSGGNWYDVSGHGHTLTYNGNPTFNYDGLVSYWDYDGTGDYHSRADEADLDILGTEAYVAAAAQGLTVGGWFWFDSVAGTAGCIGKYDGPAGNASYLIYRNANVLRTLISNTGAYIAALDLPSTVTLAISNWYFIVERFIPSTELANFVNGIWTRDTTGIPASIWNSNAQLQIGAYIGANFLDGRVSYCFLCAAALSDTAINVLYHMTKRYFGH